jgi:tetraacyldisaccharide 4'-kinase
VPLTTLAGQSPLALAGIARPQAFFDMLLRSGCPPAATLPLPDHHDFRLGADVPPGGCLICTEKDAVKLWQIRPDAWAVPLELSIAEDFWVALDARLRPKLSSSDGSQTD